MRETSLSFAIFLYMLALLAMGVVVAVLLQVRDVDPQLSDDRRLDLLCGAGAHWRVAEVGRSLFLLPDSAASWCDADALQGFR